MDAADLLLIIVGVVLLVPGGVGPSAGVFGALEAENGPVQGRAVFEEAQLEGDVELVAGEAVVAAEGALNTSVTSERAAVTFYEFQKYQADVTSSALLGTAGWTEDTNVSRESFENVTLDFHAEETANLFLWPGEHTSPTKFNAGFSSQQLPPLTSSPWGGKFWADNATNVTYTIDGPLFAIGDGVEDHRGGQIPQARIASLEATGDVVLVLDGGSVEIEHASGQTRYETGTWEGEGGAEGSLPDTRWTEYSRRAFAVVTFDAGSASLGLDRAPNADLLLLANDPAWAINGTVAMHADEGNVSAGGEERSVRNRTLQLTGNLSLVSHAVGEEDRLEATDPLGDNRWPTSTLPEPVVDARIEGNASEVTVDGRELAPASSAPVPQEVSLLGRIVGLLLLAWATLKKGLPFGVGLLAEDPLENSRRAEIHAFLTEQGFAHVRGIQEATDIPVGSLNFHLRILESAGLVRCIKQCGSKVCFPCSSGLDHREMERLALVATSSRRDLARELVEQPGLTQTELADRIGVSWSTVSKQLAKLVDAGLVEETMESPSRQYAPAPLLDRWFRGLLQG